jgi:parallel beta-helix repeat protein
MKKLIILLILLLCFSLAYSTDYYVAKTGNDSPNTGTLASPFLTIVKGLSMATSPGDVVYVKAGTYSEYVRFFNSGTSGNPITLSNYGTDIVTVDALSTNVYCVYSLAQSFITIKGIRCKDATSYIINFENCHDIIIDECWATNTTKQASVQCIMLDNGYDGTTRYNNYLIRNCTTMNGDRGIAIWNNVSYATVQGGEHSYNNVNVAVGGGYPLNNATKPTYITIDGVTAHHSVTSNIGTENNSDVTIKNCWSYNAGATGIQIETDSSNATVENNLCEDNSRTWEYETGIWIYNSANAIVRRNILRRNQTGLRIGNASNFQAYYNLIVDNFHQPTSAPTTHNTSGVDFKQSTGTFYNNTLVNNCYLGSSLSSIFVYATGTCTVNIKNNIVYNDQSDKDIVFEQATTSDYNLVYNGNRTINIVNGVTSYTWAAYKSATGQDSHSLNVNPTFVSSSDFQLQSTSTAINAGVNVGLTTDILKNSIVGLPDIGAYEYGTAPSGNSKDWKKNLRIVTHKHPIVAHGKPIY